jgi:hypothetical protein
MGQEETAVTNNARAAGAVGRTRTDLCSPRAMRGLRLGEPISHPREVSHRHIARQGLEPRTVHDREPPSAMRSPEPRLICACIGSSRFRSFSFLQNAWVRWNSRWYCPRNLSAFSR